MKGKGRGFLEMGELHAPAGREGLFTGLQADTSIPVPSEEDTKMRWNKMKWENERSERK